MHLNSPGRCYLVHTKCLSSLDLRGKTWKKAMSKDRIWKTVEKERINYSLKISSVYLKWCLPELEPELRQKLKPWGCHSLGESMSQLSVAAWGREGHHWQVFKRYIVTKNLPYSVEDGVTQAVKNNSAKCAFLGSFFHALYTWEEKKKRFLRQRDAGLSYFKLPFPCTDFLGKELWNLASTFTVTTHCSLSLISPGHSAPLCR